MNLKLPTLVFFGTPEFSIPSLKRLFESNFSLKLVVTQPDRARGRGRKISSSPVKKLATELRLPVYQPENIRSAEAVATIQSAAADCLVVVAYGQILPPELIETTPMGAVNIHPSLLPKYRGAAPIHRLIMAGERVTGITTMLLDSGMDTGPILLQAEVTVSNEDTRGTLHDRLAQKGAELLVETLIGLYSGEIIPRKQDDREATYAPPVTKKECEINWSNASRDICNQIRALDPKPGAFTFWGNTLLKLFQPRIDTIHFLGKPGTIVEVAPHGLLVKAGDGYGVRVREIQAAGQKRMKFSEFARGKGKDLKSGTVLGLRA